MKIKAVESQAIVLAMQEFDRNWRDTKSYAGWENNKNYLHALSHAGRLYPPKRVISLATGMPTSSFYGGEPSNSYLRALNFSIVSLRAASSDGESGPFNHELAKLEASQGVTYFDPANLTDARERVLRDVVQRRGQAKFRKSLIQAYGGKCAITGCAVLEILEAAHITPYLGAATNAIGNGLLLRSDIHTLWDLGLIAVEPETLLVWVSPNISDGYYRQLNGKSLHVPLSPDEQPSSSALREQWTTIQVDELW